MRARYLVGALVLLLLIGMSGAYAQEAEPIGLGVIALAEVEIRAYADADAPVVGTVTEGMHVALLQEQITVGQERWYGVFFRKMTGFVPVEAVTWLEDEYPHHLQVWIPTNGGTKYHTNAECSNMMDPDLTHVENARLLEYEACKRCKPGI